MLDGLRHFWNILVVVSAIVLIMTLLVQGTISMPLAVLAIALIPIALALGGFAGFIARASIPLLSLLTVAIAFGGGKGESIIRILSGFLMLIIIAAAFYLMFLPFRHR
jgi:hypothetical protein